MKILSKEYLSRWWCVIKTTLFNFIDDNGLKFSAALAYYTVFSLAPLLILVISLAGLFLGQQAITDTLYPHIKGFVGSEAAIQIQDMLKNLQLSGKTGTAVVIGVVTLMIGASSIFVEIQESINIIWRVKAKPKKSWLKLIQNRFISFSLIISLGFLMLVTMVINLLILALSERLQHFLPGITIWVINGISLAFAFVVIATLFGIIFKVLPDVKIKWKDVRSGAFFTAVLFMIGKYVIGLYIEFSAKTSTYGAAGSIIVILLWIYYTAAILYIGAEFTQVYAEANGSRIEPADYAVHIKQTEVEQKVAVLPLQNPELQGKLDVKTE